MFFLDWPYVMFVRKRRMLIFYYYIDFELVLFEHTTTLKSWSKDFSNVSNKDGEVVKYNIWFSPNLYVVLCNYSEWRFG